MEKRIVFGTEDSTESFKIYSIVKMERRPKSLLARRGRPLAAPDFSWPPKKSGSLISDAGRGGEDKN